MNRNTLKEIVIGTLKFHLLILFCGLSLPLSAQFFYEESCRNATGIFQYYGDAVGYTAGQSIDPVGDGWLRLTNNILSQNGYVLLDRTFPSTMGVTIEFDYVMWADIIRNTTYPIADGICVFLIDGDPDKTFQIGTPGAYFGYNNMTPAYLGVAIDPPGGFSFRDYWNNSGTPSRVFHSIAVRNATYQYVGGTSDYLGTSTDLAHTTAIATRPDDATIYRRIRIEMEPIPGGMSINVYMKTSPAGNFVNILGPLNVIQPTPALLRLGFNGSTGTACAYNEVRNVIVRTPGDMSVFKLIDECPDPDNMVIKTIITTNTNAAVSDIAVTDTLPAGFDITGGVPTVTGGVISEFALAETLGDGRKVYTFTIDALGNAIANIAYHGKIVAMPSNEQYASSVGIVPPNSFADANLNDNHASIVGKFNHLSASHTDVLLTGDPVMLTVTATNSADVTSYVWAQSDDNGVNWTPLSATGASYTHTGDTYTLVHCVAKWDSDCLDTVVFRCIPVPDNIIDADCYVTPPVQAWAIKEELTSLDDQFSTMGPILVADIDNNGTVELIAGYEKVGSYNVNKIAIVRTDGTVIRTIDLGSTYSGAPAANAVGRVKWNESEYKTIIIGLSTVAKTIDAFDAATGASVWPSPVSYTSSTITYPNGAVSMADLDGDGYTEVIIGNRVIAAETGKLLCSSTGNNGILDGWPGGNFIIQTAIADVLELGTQQICIGNTIYGVTITNRNGTSGNNMTPLKTLSPITLYDNTSPPTTDGVTQAIDFDLDGHLDVVVSTIHQTSTTLYTYVWSPHKNQIIASGKMNDVYQGSVPFVGNISGSRHPEIVYVHGNSSSNLFISAFSYNPASINKQLSLLWQIPHLDVSGTTGITLFDFNQDGISELVYRDEQQLRIINGSLKSHKTGNDTTAVYNLATYPCISGTSHEYPTIADIDNDSQAEIIVAGPSTSSTSFVNTVTGPIRIFKADAGTKWAPARKVWNQFAYNALNVNDDLTIPRYPLSSATIFPGIDGLFGTTDDVQPYNNFLQQQTALSKHGTPIWLAINAQITGNATEYYDAAGDSLTITLAIHNAGDAAIQPPFYVSAYKNAILPANVIATDSIMSLVYPDGIEEIKVIIRNVTSLLPIDSIKIQLNDRGNAAMQQSECDYTTNIVITALSDLLMAHNDYSDTIKTSCGNMPIIIDVLANDSIPDDCTAPVVSIVSHPVHVTATVNQNRIEYSSALSGSDTLVYRVTCGTNYSEAKVRVIVEASGSDLEFVDDLWYFGYNTAGTPPTYKSPGIRFVKDGSGQYVAQDASGESNVATSQNSLVVSSASCGNIFYLDHSTIYNSEHEMVENGTFDGEGQACNGLAACYMGDNKYLFFSVTNAHNIAFSVTTKALMVYAVNMNANNGKGARILSIERTLEPVGNNMSESVELVARAGTTNQYWLIYAYCSGSCNEIPYSNEMRVRLIDVSDPTNPQISAPVSYPKASGYARKMTLSQQRNRLALSHRSSLIEIFDFDNSTGVLSNRRSITESGQLESVEFSPDGNQVYFGEWHTGNFWQYDISSTTPVKVGTINGSSRGGGLKLGLDGKIYVTQCYSNKVGIISDPNLTTPLSSRYNSSGLILGVTYYAHQFSRSVTQPAVMPCTSTNTPPTTQNDSTIFCVTPTSRTAKANVLLNDSDADNNTIYLRSARFVNPADEALADISVNAADSTVTLTLKNDANIGVRHVFEIIYNVKDNGTPMSQCATGILRIKAYSPPSYPDLRLRVCPDAGNVNLAKYIDTTDNVSAIQWSGQVPGAISSYGVVSTNILASARTYTFTYTITSRCVADQTRKVYLEVIKNGNVRRLRDTIVICYEFADAVQINQIFGIESGDGDDWSYHAVNSGGGTENIDAYVSESTAPSIHAGAIVMNGKAIYEDNSIPFTNYHEQINSVKIVKFTYTSDSNTCLQGKTFTKVIALVGN